MGGRESTTTVHNTHKVYKRSVCYPWHPLYGRELTVVMEFRRAGLSVLRCRTQPGDRREHQEIPTWMFDPVACSTMLVSPIPRASSHALTDLQHLLSATKRECASGGPEKPAPPNEDGMVVTATTQERASRAVPLTPHSNEAGVDVTVVTHVQPSSTGALSTTGAGAAVESSSARCSTTDDQASRRAASSPPRAKPTGVGRVRRTQGGKQ